MTATPSSAHVPAASSGAAVDRVRPLRAAMAAVLVLGPLLFIVASLLSPYDMTEDRTRNIVADIAAHQGQEKAAAWLWMAMALLLTTAVLLACVYVAARSLRLGVAALVLFGGGVLLINAAPSQDFVVLAGLDKGVGQGALVKVIDGADGLPVLAVAGVWFIVGLVVGSVLLGIGLLRSHAVPAWAAYVLMAAMPVNVVGWLSGVDALAYAGFALLTVAFGVLALDVAHNGLGWVRAGT